MKAWLSSTEFGSVFNIVMDEEPILEEFKRGSSIDSALWIPTERLTHQHAECGTQPFRGAAWIV
jgi:hypothetical protein